MSEMERTVLMNSFSLRCREGILGTGLRWGPLQRAEGQPGDMTEVDQSGTKGMCSSKTPIICRSEERSQVSTKWAAGFISPLSPPLSVLRMKALTLLWTACLCCSSAVFKVYNMRQDLYTGQRSSRTYWDLLRGVLQSALVISPTLCPPAFLTSVSLPLKTC